MNVLLPVSTLFCQEMEWLAAKRLILPMKQITDFGNPKLFDLAGRP